MVVDKNYNCGNLDAEAVRANIARVHGNMISFANSNYTTEDVRRAFEAACAKVDEEMKGNDNLPKE